MFFLISRPRICNQVLVYIYIALFVILFLVIAILSALTALLPAYSVFIKPFTSATGEVNEDADITRLTEDITNLRAINTTNLPLPSPYREIMAYGTDTTIGLVRNCSQSFSRIKNVMPLTQEFSEFVQDKFGPDSIDKYKDAIKNSVFSPMLDYLPGYNNDYIDLNKLFRFIKNHDMKNVPEGEMDTYIYNLVVDFFTDYPILKENVMDITLANLTDSTFWKEWYTHVFTEQFLNSIHLAFEDTMTNVTTAYEVAKQSSIDVSSITRDLLYGNLTHIEGIPDDLVENLNQLVDYLKQYYSIYNTYKNAVPEFSQCALDYLQQEKDGLQDWAIHSYTSYFRKQFLFTLLMILLFAACVGAIGFLLFDIYRVVRNTYTYGREELNRITNEYKDEARNASGGILFGASDYVPVIEFSEYILVLSLELNSEEDEEEDNEPLYLKKRKGESMKKAPSKPSGVEDRVVEEKTKKD